MNNSIILTIVFASLVFSCEAGKGMHSKKYIPSAQKTKSATDMGSKKKVTAVAVIRSKAPTTPLTTPTPGPPAGDSFTLKHVMDDLNASLGAMSKAEQKRTVCQLGKEYLHRLENPAGPGLTREQRTQIEKLLYRINRLRRKLSEFGVNNENRADRDFERDRRREYISAHLYHIKRSVELIKRMKPAADAIAALDKQGREQAQRYMQELMAPKPSGKTLRGPRRSKGFTLVRRYRRSKRLVKLAQRITRFIPVDREGDLAKQLATNYLESQQAQELSQYYMSLHSHKYRKISLSYCLPEDME